VTLRPWFPAEQQAHRAELEAALDGPGPGDGAWAELAGELLGHVPTPRVDRPRAPRTEQAKARRKLAPTVCAACRTRPQPTPPCGACATRQHGDACAGGACPCRCRAGLGLTAFLDATAPEVADFEQEVA